jgi:hypothetical protein
LEFIKNGVSNGYYPGPPDADYRKKRVGAGVFHVFEKLQWKWLHEWDDRLHARITGENTVGDRPRHWRLVSEALQKTATDYNPGDSPTNAPNR